MLDVDVHPCKVCVCCLVSLLPNPPHVCPVMMSLHINFLAVCVVTMHQDTNSKLQKIQNLKQPTDNILWFIPFLILTVLGSGVCVCVCVCVCKSNISNNILPGMHLHTELGRGNENVQKETNHHLQEVDVNVHQTLPARHHRRQNYRS